METETAARSLCLGCKHFEMDLGADGSGCDTCGDSGRAGSAGCSRRVWALGADEYTVHGQNTSFFPWRTNTQQLFVKLVGLAATCHLFEPTDDVTHM